MLESEIELEAPLARPAKSGKALEELRQLLRLAVPLAFAQSGNQLMQVVDTAMVGRLPEAAQLGGLGIGTGLYFCLAVFGFGIVLGMDAPVSQAVGAGEHAAARRVLWQGARTAVLVGVPLTLLAWVVPALLEPFGVESATAREARHYIWARSPGMVPFLLFAAARSYLQANHATRPIVIAVIAANLANALMDRVLIFGVSALGVPALGVVGCGLSSIVSCLVSLGVLAVAIATMPVRKGVETRPADRAILGSIFRLGLPLGSQFLAEVGVFTLAAMLAGRISAEAGAGNQVAITLASLTFCVPVGIASAASVRVGHAVGRGDLPGVRRTGFTAIGIAAAFMSTTALLFVLFSRPLARLIAPEAAVVEAAVPLIVIAAVFQLSDGTQAVATGALRGAGDARAPLFANLVGHYAIGLTLALLLGVKLGLGAPGLWWGLSAGLTAVAIGLTTRFWFLTSRPIERVLRR
ncbi:MATE family efflux transporter [bacterium]|nr:MATE family efflux transporter [bacterium]